MEEECMKRHEKHYRYLMDFAAGILFMLMVEAKFPYLIAAIFPGLIVLALPIRRDLWDLLKPDDKLDGPLLCSRLGSYIIGLISGKMLFALLK